MDICSRSAQRLMTLKVATSSLSLFLSMLDPHK